MLVINQFIIEIDGASNHWKRIIKENHTQALLKIFKIIKLDLIKVNQGEMLTELIGQYCQTVPILHKHKPLALG